MKKIFRMALVFALAGATLMYTSCSKDYGEDIDNLDKKLTSVQSDLSTKLSDLEGRLSTLSSSVNALDAAYKAADSALDGKISGLNSDLSGLKTRVSAIEDAIKDLDKLASKAELKEVKEALEKKIDDDLKAAKEAVLAVAQNLQDQINVINEALKLKADADKVYTKEEVDAILAKYYTQEQIDAFLATKADKDAVFTKDEVLAFLAEKADKSAVYTKEEIAKILEDYFTKEQVNELLAKKADKDAVYTKEEIAEILTKYFTKEEVVKMLEDYYTKAEIAELLAKYYTKAEIDELIAKYYTKDEVDGLLKNYFTKEEIEAMFAKYYTKDEVDKILENYYTKDELYTKAEIEALLAKYYTKEEIDAMFAKYYTKEEVDTLLAAYYNKDEIDALLDKKADKEEMEAKLKEAQEKLDEVFAILSDELRSIVFLPDLYFAGVEATTYDFGSFLGFDVIALAKDTEFGYGEDDEDALVKFQKGAKVYADLLCYRDKSGKIIYYKFDPETMDYVRDDAGNPVEAKPSDEYRLPYYPGNFVVGQVGKAMYNLNPSSFDVNAAEWSLEGRDVKYVVKGESETPWTPEFIDIEKDADGLATVYYEILNPEWLFSSVIGGVVSGVISWIGTIERVIDLENYVEDSFFDLREGSYYNYLEFVNKLQAAFAYGFNNIPTMHLVGQLDENRRITSDWHAISSTEELVSHLAFRDDNKYEAYEDCGLSLLEMDKDLYYDAYSTLDFAPSVPVKYNGGPVDLAKLIAIHTQEYESGMPYASYTLEEFNAKYPGFHYEFELVPYTLGDTTTGEQYYGQIEGTVFTPCYVKSEAKPVSYVIPADPESTVGISSVGRKPMVIATLVNDETGIVQTVGWFRILIVKDIKDPITIMLPEQPTVPYICGDFRLATTWYDFSDFVLEQLGMDYKVFRATYDFDGVYTIIGGKYVEIDGPEGLLEVPTATDTYERWGRAVYYIDESGTGINDAFIWDVDPRGFGESKTKTIYYKFVNGEEIVYFGMTATTAERAHLNFVENKIAKEWTSDIDGEANNTALMNVPVPTADKVIPATGGPGGDVKLFQRDINHWFVGYWPILGVKAETDPLYAKFFNTSKGKDPDAIAVLEDIVPGLHMPELAYDDKELNSNTTFFFEGVDANYKSLQPTIVDYVTNKKYPLYTNWYGPETVNGTYYEKGKLLYVADTKADWWIDADTKITIYKPNYKVKDGKVVADNRVAWIMPREYEYSDEGELLFVSDTLKYLDTDVAKELLNLWSYNEKEQKHMLYANILAVNTYGFCEIPTDDGHFHVRFVRPLDVDFADQDVAQESEVDGCNVEIAKFISGITDWNHQSVIEKEMKKNAAGKMEWTGYYVPSINKTVNMYDYYGFTELRIDLAAAEINNWKIGQPDLFEKLSVVLPKAKLQVGTVSIVTIDDKDHEVFTPIADAPNPYVVDMTDFNNLKGIYVNYRNDESISDKFTIRMPVEIDYAWGTMKAYMNINVKKTQDTDPA